MQESDQGAGLLAGYMTSQQVARDLGVGVRTLDRWHQLRKGPPRTRLGKRVLGICSHLLVFSDSRFS